MQQYSPPLFTQFEIIEAIKKIANSLDNVYRSSKEDVTFLCVLNGGMRFCADLMTHIQEFDPILSFIKVQSYEGREQKELKFIFTPPTDEIKDKHVLILDDIYDSGNTMKFISTYLRGEGALSVISCCLLKKENISQSDTIFGLEVPQDNFIFGYGLDNNGKSRSLNAIYKLTK